MKRFNLKMRTGFLTVAGMICVLAGTVSAQRYQQDQQQQDGNNYNNNGQNEYGNGGGRRGRRGMNQGFNNQGGGYNQGYGGQRFQYNQYSQAASVGGDDYGIISQQNIFLRDRRIRPVIPAGPGELPPEQANVVTGIVFDDVDQQYHAYMETISGRNIGQVQRLKAGDKIAIGEIVDMRIDKVGYRRTGSEEITWVSIGSNLTGEQVGSVSDFAVRSAAEGGGGQFQRQFAPAVAPPSLDPNTANLSMEERMKLRRATEGQTGAAPAPAPAPAAEPAAEQAPALALPPTDAAQNAGLSIEERMRLRRQQEQGAGR
ncbi:MAG TPA: hypothetical protein VHD56_06045 [Tepidisphaeraceae bacterium]|nr:hypothetical protein [Tepidisphaeraceae bacterium]